MSPHRIPEKKVGVPNPCYRWVPAVEGTFDPSTMHRGYIHEIKASAWVAYETLTPDDYVLQLAMVLPVTKVIYSLRPSWPSCAV